MRDNDRFDKVTVEVGLDSSGENLIFSGWRGDEWVFTFPIDVRVWRRMVEAVKNMEGAQDAIA